MKALRAEGDPEGWPFCIAKDTPAPTRFCPIPVELSNKRGRDSEEASPTSFLCSRQLSQIARTRRL